MFRHRRLIFAALSRHGTPPARRLALFLVVFLSLAAGVPFAAAEMVYYTEDFCNDYKPGFDPLFNHQFDWPDDRDPAQCRYIYPPNGGYPAECALGLFYGTTDTITFDLPPNTAVVFASVEAVESAMSQYGYVRFIGSNGIFETSYRATGEYLFEVSSSEIGTIQAIEVYDRQGFFSTVTIGVVPEPSSIYILSGAFVLMTSPFVSRYRRRI